MIVVVVVHRRWIVEFYFSYQLPITWFVAWVHGIVLEYGLVVIVVFELVLVDTVLEITWSSTVPLYVKPVFSIRKHLVVV